MVASLAVTTLLRDQVAGSKFLSAAVALVRGRRRWRTVTPPSLVRKTFN